jgi:hypothetical protein
VSEYSVNQIDDDIVKAIIWCRLGRVRPEKADSFERAKALGLLAQDGTWRATERGEGVLIAYGLLKGEPAPRRWDLVVLWVANDEDGAEPNMVASWSTDQHENDGVELEAIARRRWTTIEHLDLPIVPEGLHAHREAA